MIELEGQSSFRGKILHSSQLDEAELRGKKVVIVGSGASGVEAAELAVQKKAKGIVVLARSDKWVIPRNTIVDVLLSLQPFGRQMVSTALPPPTATREQRLMMKHWILSLSRSFPNGLFASSTTAISNTSLPQRMRKAYSKGQLFLPLLDFRGVQLNLFDGQDSDRQRRIPRTHQGRDRYVQTL